MERLPQYGGDKATCVKCGYHGASTTWLSAGQLCKCAEPTGIDERLCRECTRCGYHWDEETIGNVPVTLTLFAAREMIKVNIHWLYDQGFRVVAVSDQFGEQMFTVEEI